MTHSSNSSISSDSNQSQSTLILLKSIFFPVVTLGLALIITYIPFFSQTWCGRQNIWNLLKTGSSVKLWLMMLFPLYFLLIFAFFGVKLLNHLHDIREISFLHALQHQNYWALGVVYPVTLLMEEILFRGILNRYLFLYFSSSYGVALLNGCIFALYHLHIYFTSQNLRLTIFFIGASWVLGTYLSYFMPYGGVLGCWIIHMVCVTCVYIILWISWNQKNKKDILYPKSNKV